MTVPLTMLSHGVNGGPGRLRQRLEYSNFPNSPSPGRPETPTPPPPPWVLDSETDYIYDGFRVIQERSFNPQLSTLNSQQTTSYTRGTDPSGSLEGAGGIGGLLARTDSGLSTINSPLSTGCHHSDGNGNITYLVDSSQALAASYRYDPFGNMISHTGTLWFENVYRFSSKEIHVNSGMYYYGYRFYDPNLQRWINRDPVAERGFRVLRGDVAAVSAAAAPAGAAGTGGHADRIRSVFAAQRAGAGAAVEPNLYRFVENEPVRKIDPYGLILPPAEMPCWNPPTPSPDTCEELCVLAGTAAAGLCCLAQPAACAACVAAAELAIGLCVKLCNK